MVRRRLLRLKKTGFNGFMTNAKKPMIIESLVPEELRIRADLAAWFRNFVHERARQGRLAGQLQRNS
jgi:hypothetical protein